MNARKIICIVGPTASGKTGVGVKLAQKFDGEIFSADSRQVYRRLDIGTGKEGIQSAKLKVKSEKLKVQVKTKKLDKLRNAIRYVDSIPQWLIDICEPGEKFTVFDWLRKAKLAIDDIFNRGKLPIVVGGTGLYVQALTEGFHLSEKLKVKSGKKKYTRQELEGKTPKELQKIYWGLETKDWRLDTHNPRRLIGAIEKAQGGIQARKSKPDFEVMQIGIDIPREKLYEKIDRRVDERFKQGMLEEVQGLLNSGVSPKWLSDLGLEYKIIGSFILNPANMTFEQMSQELKYKIHAFARRQMTWFRHHGEIKWVKDYKEAERLTKQFLSS